jgi:hypothetical protein
MFLLDPPSPRHATVADRAARIGTIEDAIFEAFPVESVRDAVVRCRTSDALSFLGF